MVITVWDSYTEDNEDFVLVLCIENSGSFLFLTECRQAWIN